MRGAFGALGWAPDTFWRSTLTEYMAAIAGHNHANGGKDEGKGPSDDELAALVAKYG